MSQASGEIYRGVQTERLFPNQAIKTCFSKLKLFLFETGEK
jgi:hypothetical protein